MVSFFNANIIFNEETEMKSQPEENFPEKFILFCFFPQRAAKKKKKKQIFLSADYVHQKYIVQSAAASRPCWANVTQTLTR
jgi:hypothetical protein